MVKKKVCSLLAAMMIATMVLGNSGQVVGATTIETQTVLSSERKVENGTYEVENQALKTGQEAASTMQRYIERTSTIKVEDDKITVTLRFNEDGLKVVQEVRGATVDGVEVEMIHNEDGSVSFIVPSVDSIINIELAYAMGDYASSAKFDLVNDTTSIPTVEGSENGGDTEGENGNSGENGGNTEGDNGNNGGEESVVLEDGNYVVNNGIYKVGTTQSSMARQFIGEQTKITVKDGKITMTMTYQGLGLTGIRGTAVKVNGERVNSTVNADKSVSFEVPSIDAKIEVELDIHVESMGFSEVQSVDLVNDITTLEKVEDNNGSNDNNNSGNTGSGDNNGGNTGGSGSNNSGNDNVVQATKVYTIKNEVSHESEIGTTMARKYLSDTSKVEEINGKYYVTLVFTGADLMQNHEVSVNGSKVETTKTVNGDETRIRFAVGSISDKLSVSTYVVPMGKNVDFSVNLLKDTLTLVEDNSSADDIISGGNTSDGNTSGNTSGSTSDTTTEENKVITGKLYSIQNNVKHESETGVAMARKYLSSTSKVEEIDGKWYVTLTFTGAEFMQSHVIYVNGSKVSTTKSTSGDTTTVRFQVSKLSDTIKVKVYVVPMDKEVEFEVELLEDTLTFIKDFTVSTLPNTGGTSAAAVLGLGAMLTTAGSVLTRKRK